MADTTWLSYLGAITGTAGALMGFVSLRRTKGMKALDLRLILRKAESDLHNMIESLPAMIARAKQSREAVAAAKGRTNSGAMEQWKSEWERDSKTAQTMASHLSRLNDNHCDSSPEELESAIVQVHNETTRLQQIIDKYRANMAEDDKTHEQHRADQRVVNQARLEGKH